MAQVPPRPKCNNFSFSLRNSNSTRSTPNLPPTHAPQRVWVSKQLLSINADYDTNLKKVLVTLNPNSQRLTHL